MKNQIRLSTVAALILLVISFGSKSNSFPAQKVKAQSRLHKASFAETYDRYPDPYDLFYHLQRVVPFVGPNSNRSEECSRLGQENTTVLGGNVPGFGAPMEDEPGAIFTDLYVRCFNEAFQLGFQYDQDTARKNFEAILGSDLTSDLMKSFSASIDWETLANSEWRLIPIDLQQRILARLVKYLVGPDDLLNDKDLIGEDSVFGPDVKTKADLLKLIERESLANGRRLYDVLRGSAILLRLGPTVLKQ